MTTQQLPTEEELTGVLRDDTGLFMQALYEYYAGKIMAWLGTKSFDVLDEHELADAFQETMSAVWQRVEKPGFDPNRPLRMVFRIARNTAVSFLRKRLRIRRVANESDITDLLISNIEGSDLALAVRLQSEDEMRRFREILPGIVAELPKRQRAAAMALLECYEDIRHGDKWEQMTESIGALTGKRVTVAAATSATRAALAKIRSELAREEFELVEGRLI